MGLADIDATYTTTIADLGVQNTWENTGFDEAETNLKANTDYQETERQRREPGVYRGNANQANRGGVLTSGINGRRRGDIEAGFGAQKTGTQLQLTEGLAGIKHKREGASLEKTKGEHGALDRKREQTDQWNAEHPPPPPALPVQAAAAPGAPAKPDQLPGTFTSPQQRSQAEDEAATSVYIQSHPPAAPAARYWNAGTKRMERRANGKWLGP